MLATSNPFARIVPLPPGDGSDLNTALQDFGFMNIFVFKGGWKSWTDAGMEIEIHE